MKSSANMVFPAALTAGFLFPILAGIIKSGTMRIDIWVALIPLGLLACVSLLFFRRAGATQREIFAQHCAFWPTYALCMLLPVGQTFYPDGLIGVAVIFVSVFWGPLLFLLCYVLGYMLAAGAGMLRPLGFCLGCVSGCAVFFIPFNGYLISPSARAWLVFMMSVLGSGALGYALASLLAHTAFYARFDSWLSRDDAGREAAGR